MNIARFSVTRPVAVTMRIAALVLLGAICLVRLPIDLLPKVTIPTVVVSTSWANVAPEEMETQVTRPIEQAVSSAPNVNQVSSSTSQGQSSVRIQFNWGTDIGQAAVDVLQLVQRAKRSLPNDDALSDPVVFKFDPSTLPIRIYGVSGIDDPVKLRTLLDTEVAPMIESADGVAAATVTGGDTRAVIVDVDPKRLQAYNLSLKQVSDRLTEENLNVPGGIARQGQTEFVIRSVGNFAKPEDALQVPLTSLNGQIVSLADVATVRDTHPETRLYTRLNGQPAVGVIVSKQSGANTVSTAASLDRKVEAALEQYPDLKFNIAYDQSGFIEHSIEDLKATALIGGVLAVGILMMFLRNVRSTMVVGLSIPFSIVSTFALLYFGGFTLNTISLSGLALATGLIVDDAVVVLENIFRHIERDKLKPAEAAVTGTTEILSAVVASTLTIMIVFMPLLLIQGQAGQTFTQFALVVIFSIAVSLLDAMTVVPMLASRLIKEEEVLIEAHPELRAERGLKAGWLDRLFDWLGQKFHALDEGYRGSLRWALKHRWTVLGIAAGTTGLSVFLIPLVGSETLPQTDSGDFTVNVRMPVGTALAVTDEKVREVERILMADPDVETVFSASGTTLSLRGTTSSAIANQGSATVRLKSSRKRKTQDVIKAVQGKLGQISGARILVTPYDLVTNIISGGNTNMEVDVFGSDLKQISATAKTVAETMRSIPGLESVDVSVQDSAPEIQWTVDRTKAEQLGISFSDVAAVLDAATTGRQSGYYHENGFQFPINVQVPESDRKTIDQLKALPVQASLRTGGVQPTVRLGDIASATVALGPNEITRIDRQRYVAITGRVSGRPESDVQADIATAMGKSDMPEGTRWDFGRNQKRRAEEFSGMGLAVVLAVSLIYMLLASQFESFVMPLVVLTSVPLCSIGVFLALFLTGRAMGLTAFIGLLMLVGIVVKNGILLVDYTDQLRRRGVPRDEAILTAGPTRLRPILMTTCAAVMGMIPLALALGRGSETQAPLATAVIGGLTTSTILTLLVVPVVYTLFDDLIRKWRKTDRDLTRADLVQPSVAGLAAETEAPEARP
ncbi:MAG: efflux RND transporter permease subunit [Armatimonadetes bacterium]|nr:efflux RND transporter permease subunit [Armatimonadota bacterium]